MQHSGLAHLGSASLVGQLLLELGNDDRNTGATAREVNGLAGDVGVQVGGGAVMMVVRWVLVLVLKGGSGRGRRG